MSLAIMNIGRGWLRAFPPPNPPRPCGCFADVHDDNGKRAMPIKRICIGCLQLYNRDSNPGKRRCLACQQKSDKQKNTRGNTTARGYGTQHQQLRARLLEQFQPGQPCTRCGKPITTKQDADLGHADGQQGYRGLEHRQCNRGSRRTPAGKHSPARTADNRYER
jgi:hypothetical protein